MIRFTRIHPISISKVRVSGFTSSLLPSLSSSVVPFRSLPRTNSFKTSYRDFATRGGARERTRQREREREEEEKQQSQEQKIDTRDVISATSTFPSTKTDDKQLDDTQGPTFYPPPKTITDTAAIDKVNKTYKYILGGVGLTGLGGWLSFKTGLGALILGTNPWMALGAGLAVSIPTLIGTMMTGYHQNPTRKHIFWSTFCLAMGAQLGYLGLVFGSNLIFEAALATGVTVGTLSLIGWKLPVGSTQSWQKPLGFGIASLVGVGLASMIWPGNSLLYNIFLYGGVALFGAATISDTNQLLANAMKEGPAFDPINESLSIYLNIINIFVRILEILGRKD